MPVWHGVESSTYFTSEEYAVGYDEVTITIPTGATSATATLFYQTMSKEYMEFLRSEINGTATTLPESAYIVQTDTFFTGRKDWGEAIWDLNGGSSPIVMTSLAVEIPVVVQPQSGVTATATTVIFTDPVLTQGVTIAKVAHITELRTAVKAVRTLSDLSAASLTDSTLPWSTTIKRVHVMELRTALDAARSTFGLSAMSYTDPTITAGVSRIKAAHITELRNGVK